MSQNYLKSDIRVTILKLSVIFVGMYDGIAFFKIPNAERVSSSCHYAHTFAKREKVKLQKHD